MIESGTGIPSSSLACNSGKTNEHPKKMDKGQVGIRSGYSIARN